VADDTVALPTGLHSGLMLRANRYLKGVYAQGVGLNSDYYGYTEEDLNKQDVRE